jgi:hypothetical protein
MPGFGAPKYSKATWLPSGETAGVSCRPGIATKGLISLATAGCFESLENTQKSMTVKRRKNAKAPVMSQGSGSPGILLYQERLRRSVPGLRTAGSIKNATMGGRVQVKQATLPDVAFGNSSREIPVLLLPSPAADMLPGIDGIVGVAALQARRVHLDFARKALAWE